MTSGKSKKRVDTDSDATQARQSAFIAAYGEVGSIRRASEAASVSRSTVAGWISKDIYNFKTKYETAREMFREFLQDVAVQRVGDQGPRDNPLLLITLLNAHWPEKYRRDANVVTNEVKEMMSEWKRYVRESNRKTKPSPELKEAEEARKNAMNEVEHILSRKRQDDSGTE